MTKILIVEDEPNMVSGLRDNFEYEGYQVITAGDGLEGLNRALSDSPDLVVLDVMMPKMSGLDVCKQLKAKRPSLPIIMLTARGQEVDKVVGLELGADDYVTKPFSIRELLARIKAVLRRAQALPKEQDRYAFGDVEVNLRSYQVLRRGKQVEFSAKEFELLKYFLCHPGETLSRDRLLDEVWGYENYPTTRTVDAHLVRLRQKLEPVPDAPRFSSPSTAWATSLSADPMSAHWGERLNRLRKPSHRAKRLRSAARPARARSAAGLLASAAGFPAAGRTAREELAAVRREFKELQDAVFEANRVQRKLCAPRELRRASFEMAGEMFAVRQLSGDFFKLFDLGSSVGFAVGDVAGKGIAAGMWLTHLMGLVRCHMEREPDLAVAMAEVNRGLCGLVAEPPLAALFLGRIELATGALTYCNAGQPEALVLRGAGPVESLDAGGPMLGAIPAAKFETGRTALAAGDTLVACTDGAVECRNARDEEFGAARLAAAATQGLSAAASAGQILFSTLGAVLDFANGRPVADDLTLLVLHRLAPPSRNRAA